MKTSINALFLCLLGIGSISQAIPINIPRIRLLSSASVAAFAGLCAASKSEERKTIWVKPDWATKFVPNGVPKELDDQIKFLRNPQDFIKLGAKIPKGWLLHGPPGTGKTSTAQAVAHELKAPFIQANGTDFTAELHGLGAAKVKAFFNAVREQAAHHPKRIAVAFIDEIDIIAAQRGSQDARGQEEHITAFLTEVDGFNKNSDLHIVVIGATNRKEILDPAIIRSGRLEVLIEIPLPNKEGRADIIKHYMGKIKYEGPDMCTALAEQTEGMSGADLEKLINDAAILAGSEKANAVTQNHLFAAMKKNNIHIDTSNKHCATKPYERV